MEKALVLYDSLFGNTKTIALSIAEGIREVGVTASCQSIDEFNINEIMDFFFVAIGSPTHILKTSKPMKEFLQELKAFNLEGKSGFAFDTRNESRMNKRGLFGLENSAARVIEGWMKRMRMVIVKSRESALVDGREGPLDQGAIEAFRQIGWEIGNQLKKSGEKGIVGRPATSPGNERCQ